MFSTPVENQGKVIKLVDRTIKKAVDHIAVILTKKYGYQFSPSTQNEIVNLTINYIKRLTEIISSEKLEEPEKFDSVYWDVNHY